MNKFLFLFLCFLFSFGSIQAQEQVIKNFTVKDGLPSATVYCVLQDKKGYIWFGTENGACRFDGVNFVNYTTKDGLTDNSILYMNQDQLGRIWLHGFKGLPCFYLDGKIHNAHNDHFLASLPKWGFVLHAKQIENGPLYFSTDVGIIKITKNGYQKYIIPLNHSNQYKAKVDSNIWIIVPNNKKYSRKFFEEKDGIFYFSDKHFIDSSKLYPNLVKTIIPNKYQEPIFQEKIGADFWMASYYDGLLKISDIHSKTPKLTEYFKGIQIGMVLKDAEGNLWFTSPEKGVMVIMATQANMQYYPNIPYLNSENILRTCKQKNSLWAGLTKNRLVYIDSFNSQQIDIPHFNDQKKSAVYDIIIDSNQNVIVATSLELYQLTPKSRVKPQWEFIPIDNKRGAMSTNNKALCIDGKNRLIVCEALQYTIFNYQKKRNRYEYDTCVKLTGDRIFTCLTSSTGEVYIASRKGLFNLINNELLPLKINDTLGDEPIVKMAELSNKKLILVTRNKGVLLCTKQKIIQSFGENDGLSSNICNKVWVHNNLIYIATANGVNVLKLVQNKLVFLQKYNTQDGLLSDEINDVSVINHTIFAATAIGLNSFQSKNKQIAAAPPVNFLAIKNNSKDVLFIKDPMIKQEQSSMEISFRAITFQAPNNTEYAYRLIGLNPIWKRSFNNRIEYPNLPEGNFIFEVKAKNTNSVWSTPIRFSFQVYAPFYQHIAFILFGYSLLLAFLFWLIYSYLKHQKSELRKKQEIQSRLETLEFQALNALMNPHFIFNALNSIQQFLNENNALEANKFLSKFASLIRLNMESVMKRNILVEDELERLKLYLRFEKLRLSDRLTFSIDISNEVEIESLLIPPMALQPIVENAIWHGLVPNQTIHIQIQITPIDSHFFQIEISDNGLGYENSKNKFQTQEGLGHQSRGLDFIKQRLSLWTHLNNTSFALCIAQQPPQTHSTTPGTIVILKLPVIMSYEL
jgi:sensor histidine kinase YesM/streptogramin lyase